MKLNRLLIISFAMLALILPGCLRIKQQSITAKFDKKSKQLTFLLIYEGLYVDSSGVKPKDREKDLAEAKEQLAAFVGSQQRFALLDGSIDMVNLGRAPTDKEDIVALKRKFASQLEVRNGAFVLNDNNELSIYQTIIIQDYTTFAKFFNEAISTPIDEIVTKKLSEPRDDRMNDPISDESYRLIQRAARTGHEWLKISHGKIEVNFPILPEDAKKAVVELEKTDASGKFMQSVREAAKDFRIMHGESGLSLSLGDGNSAIIEVQGPRASVAKPDFEGDLFTYARTLRLPFDRSQDTMTLRRSFSKAR